MAKAIAVLALGLIVMSHLSSCTKTETVTQWDTTYVKVHDTVGSAALRFIPVLPDSFGAVQEVRLSKTGPKVYVLQKSPGAYMMVKPDTSSVYYLFNSAGGSYIDQIPLSGFKPNSITSVVVYNDQSGIEVILANDSQKVIPPPAGYCYVRFINTISEHTGGTYFSVDADNLGNSIVKAGYAEASEYAMLQVGFHNLLIHVAGDNSGNLVDTVKNFNVFQDGGYYTVVASQSGQTDKYAVYPE